MGLRGMRKRLEALERESRELHLPVAESTERYNFDFLWCDELHKLAGLLLARKRGCLTKEGAKELADLQQLAHDRAADPSWKERHPTRLLTLEDIARQQGYGLADERREPEESSSDA